MTKEILSPYTNILVLGMAKSGAAVAKLLLKHHKNVRINDKGLTEDTSIVQEFQSLGAEVICGGHPISVLDEMEMVIKNPGIPYEHVIIQEAIKRNIPVITEIELADKLTNGSIIGITGSNGKTTTTMLITEMLKESAKPVKIAGNIGYVASEVAQTTKDDEHLVLELSSFQLMGIQTFKPKIAVLLNIFEAHLDYHKTFANYKAAKCNIFKNQTDDDVLVYNAEEPVVCDAVKQAKSQLIPFSSKRKLTNGAWSDKHSIYFKEEKIIDKNDIVLVGEHNIENILAAVCAAKMSGATNKGICAVLRTFTGVRHRLQFIGNIHGRLFYNDSKATNILATQKALSSFNKPTILLAGGLDRGNGFDDLLPYLQNVKAIILFGETKGKLKSVAKKAQIKTIIMAENVEDAAIDAYQLSDTDDIILLSPACASWDQYKTFEQRGDMFISAVHKLL